MRRVNKSATGPGGVDADNRIDLIYVGPKHEFPDCTVRAIRSEIGDIGILQTSSPSSLLEKDLDLTEAQLVLVHERLCLQCIALHGDLRAALPNASVAIACTGVDENLTSIRRLLACEAVRGILPFDLKLDVWLSALRLLLTGGDYCPAKYAHLLPLQGLAKGQNRPAYSKASHTTGPAGDALTQRETDVLGLVAQGLQNKLIASKLDLSEHTVKLHIHHIISKLGVHNRTEAAAVYLNGLDN